jgi:chromosomal replication initiator protein
VDNVNPPDPQAADDLAERVWDQARGRVRAELADSTWQTWFHGLRPLRLRDDVLHLSVPNQVAAAKIRSQYLPILESALLRSTGRPLAVDLEVDTEARVEEVPLPRAPSAPPALVPVADSPAAGPDFAPPLTTARLNPRYTFSQFVIGASNRFAHAAALQVAEEPATAYNPLFIYGRAGLGKTHLLHAVGHHLLDLHPNFRVRYVNTESYMNDFVEAIRDRSRMPLFKRRYRELDALLIDDIQFLERTEELQEEFFHTFNHIHNNGGQIIISSDRSPKNIATLEDRLRSRFEWGLITDVVPPEFETRLAILRKKTEAEHLHGIPDEVLAFIASSIEDNIRELEGALIRIAAYSSLNRKPLSEEVARSVLADIVPEREPREITPALILDETSKQFGWTLDELCGKSRRRPLVTARQIGMYVMRELTDLSFPRIAEEFGGRDHTTVMYAVAKIREQMQERHHTFAQVNELMKRIRRGSAS